MIMEPTPANMQSFETVQSVLLWAQLKGDSLQASLHFWVLKLMIILLFRKLLGRSNREVVCDCQACEAGSKAKMVVASGAAVLTFTHHNGAISAAITLTVSGVTTLNGADVDDGHGWSQQQGNRHRDDLRFGVGRDSYCWLS